MYLDISERQIINLKNINNKILGKIGIKNWQKIQGFKTGL